MKKTTNLVVRCLFGAILVMLPHKLYAQNHLVVLNWDDYLDEELVERFERQYNAELIQILYSSEEDRTARLASNDALGYDLILTSGIDLGRYVKRGWIAPIDEDRLHNLIHVDPGLREAFPAGRRYAIPYSWGTLGILYRNDLVPTPITSWIQLFRPARELQGKINLLEDGRELIGMGLKALGYSANSTDSVQLKAVESLLLAQKPFVKSYIYMSLEDESAIKSGEILASMAYNCDAQVIKEFNSNLTYVVPAEGSNVWIDYLVIAARSQNPDLAYKFLNFINEPANAAQLAASLQCASANTAANKLLPASFINDPLIYPGRAQLARSEYYKPLSARAQRRRNQITTRVLR